MPPMHWTPLGGIRVKLKKHVVFAESKVKAVWVVHPPDGRHDVIRMSVRRNYFIDIFRNVFIGVFYAEFQFGIYYFGI